MDRRCLKGKRPGNLGAVMLSYRFLARRQRSRYEQLFIAGRNLRAETIYRQTIGVDPRTPHEVAVDYDLPVEAIHEAIQYCIENAELLQREREDDFADLHARGLLRSMSSQA
jgi:uncharacterized protein (DUF433 family)